MYNRSAPTKSSIAKTKHKKTSEAAKELLSSIGKVEQLEGARLRPLRYDRALPEPDAATVVVMHAHKAPSDATRGKWLLVAQSFASLGTVDEVRCCMHAYAKEQLLGPAV